MAANDYYNSTASHHGHGHPALDGPSPIHSPDPYTAYTPYHTQPAPSMSSSLEDSSYRPYADHSQPSIASPYYASGGGGREHEPSAYSDDIPLRQHPSKPDSDVAIHDHLPDDPAIVDRPSRTVSRKRRKEGFLGRRIPWVVYTFTLIQVCVFIAELAKNGRLNKFE